MEAGKPTGDGPPPVRAPGEPPARTPLEAAQKLAENVLRELTRYASRYHEQAPGEVHLSVVDARLLDEDGRRHSAGGSEFIRPSTVEDGDSFTIWGRPGRATDRLRPGHAFIGFYVKGPGIGYEG